ncbi:MAG: Polyamine aminopropyltransferase [Turneriella sp.]|nr:Polyamine aminopropyltransferase [Turneriella sp.]
MAGVKREDLLVETLNPDMGYFFRSAKKLFETRTKFQDLEIHELPRHGKMLRLDGVFQTSDNDEFLYHEPLVHVGGISIDGPKKALVIGGGDGGAAEEFLKYKTVEKVVMVELDGDVVEACKEYIPNISNGAFSNPKLELRIEDGIKYVFETKEVFDQVLLDLTDPFGPSIELYTHEFYQQVSKILSDTGVLSLHIESPITRPELFGKLYWTLKSVFNVVRPMTNYVPLYGALWGFALASKKIDPLTVAKDVVLDRLNKHQLGELKFYNEDTHHSLMALPNYVRTMLAQKQTPIHKGDTLPVPAGSKRNLHLYEKEG